MLIWLPFGSKKCLNFGIVLTLMFSQMDWHWPGSKSFLEANQTKAYETTCACRRLKVKYIMNIIIFSLFLPRQVLFNICVFVKMQSMILTELQEVWMLWAGKGCNPWREIYTSGILCWLFKENILITKKNDIWWKDMKSR